MKRNRPPYRPVALAALIVAAATALNPVFAQDAATTVQAPPVAAPAPAPPAPEAAAPAPAPVFAPKQEVAQPTPPRAEAPAPAVADSAATAEPAPRAPASRVAPAISATRARPATRPAVAAVAPVAQTSSAEVINQATPVPSATEPADSSVAVPTDAPVAALPETAPAAVDAVPVESNTSSITPILWIALAIGLIALIAGYIMRGRRRRRNELVYETVAYDEAPAVAAAAPVDLQERPWIRLALQPIGSTLADGAHTIEYDLIVENEGKLPASDVRVSSYLTGARSSSLGDALANGQAQTQHINVAAGESVTLYGKVIAPDGSDPRIVADARYLLPNGTDGHLAARFVIDMSAPKPAAEVEDVMERV